jgi:transposase
MAHREALHRVDGTGARQPSERQAQGFGQAQPQPRRTAVLRDRPLAGAQQRHCAGRLLSAPGRASRWIVANIALARKLAILFWRVMVKGLNYVEHGLAQYEAKVLQTQQRTLRRLAKQLGQQLVPIITSA